jgi:two-component system sensor histidine kinase KdpD
MSSPPSKTSLTSHRGELRVFLGAAPGVGKTYAMLNAGRVMRDRGEDVVVGYVETHARADTEAQIGDLEVVPRRQLSYRGIQTEEMDLDAIIRRHPQVVLVDELAHTNPPGGGNERRYQDVEAIRDAGIDVVTTLNVQHLESLQDIVLGITGVQVRETVPDRILDDATDVHLIDLPTEDLLERLEQGKVYPPGRADQAMRNFFRAGNLTALRQLALRRTADEVDERLEGYMRAHDIDAVWPTAERVVVVMDHRVESSVVVRHAWRLASALRGELVAVAVVPPDGTGALPVDQRHGLERNLRLLDDLGGVLVPIDQAGLEPMPPAELASRIAQICRDENATILVLGHRPRGWWRRVREPSLVDRVLAEVDGVGLYLVELGAPGDSGPAPARRSLGALTPGPE